MTTPLLVAVPDAELTGELEDWGPRIGPAASHTAKPPMPINTITARAARTRADARLTLGVTVIGTLTG